MIAIIVVSCVRYIFRNLLTRFAINTHGKLLIRKSPNEELHVRITVEYLDYVIKLMKLYFINALSRRLQYINAKLHSLEKSVSV